MAFNTPLILLQASALFFTLLYVIKERDMGWGTISSAFWFLTALMTFKNSISDYPIARFYVLIGSVFVVLVLYDVGMVMKKQGDYWF